MHIRELQELMRRLYFHRDSERGIAGTYDWLVEEVEELGEALNADDKEAAKEEFCRCNCVVSLTCKYGQHRS